MSPRPILVRQRSRPAIVLRPDVILMDVRLKRDTDGIHASEMIQRLVSVPVVFVTAYTDFATLKRAKATAHGYIRKPFNVSNLLVAIDVAVHRFKMEQHLKDSLLTYATILRSSPDGVIATDVNGRVRFMNPAAERLTDWSIRHAQDSHRPRFCA